MCSPQFLRKCMRQASEESIILCVLMALGKEIGKTKHLWLTCVIAEVYKWLIWCDAIGVLCSDMHGK
jgi:hypothetical protein